MVRFHRRLPAALFALFLLLTISVRAGAQPKRAGAGRAPTPAANRTVGSSNIPVAPAATTQIFNYNIYPTYAAQGYSGYSSAPFAGSSVPVVNHYYYALNYYVPPSGPRLVGGSVSPYDLPWWFFASVEPFSSLMPRNTEPTSKEAKIEILMPRSDAVLLVDGNKTTADGLRRLFSSPELEPGKYSYQLTAHWISSGEEVRLERTVEVSPGGTYFVDFNKIEVPEAKTVSK